MQFAIAAIPSNLVCRILLVLSIICGCQRTQTVQSSIPLAIAYEHDPLFVGEWVGEIGNQPGVLILGELSPGKYFGSFEADDRSNEFVLLLEQDRVRTQEGGEVPSNRMLFTWQDGLGGRGRGWLLINREDTAITGSFGYGESSSGLNSWTFIRVDE